jgi:hypothetical protein
MFGKKQPNSDGRVNEKYWCVYLEKSPSTDGMADRSYSQNDREIGQLGASPPPSTAAVCTKWNSLL